ncbi:MAG TPA: tRNA epoxyqueuosine(34) reductase QueG, partial [Blastocatellia bacterium]|nr:tRNA epoxyqueuosine(34) reductase QueG [Blastocatellia bacterium]
MGDIVSDIKEAACNLGFEVAGITNVEPLDAGLTALTAWCDAGMAAGMGYMTRNPALHANPSGLVPTSASLISLAVNYFAETPAFTHDNTYGRIARYAWGRDYHDVVRPRLLDLANQIRQIAPGRETSGSGFSSRAFIDAVPLLERAVANRAGFGFFGKNTNLILPRRGSWFFLAEIFLNIELPEDYNANRVSCGTCRRCLKGCPTDAFSGPYILDSSKCISYLTIENKGPIPRELRSRVGEWLFGCDVCQEVCPFNRFSSETQWPELRPEAGPGTRIDLSSVLSIATDSEFRARFQGTCLMRPKRRGLLRNAAIVAANVGCEAALQTLIERIENDPEALIRSHALWAAARLDWSKVGRLVELARTDPD